MAQIFLNNLRARLASAVLAADTILPLVAGAGLPAWNSGDWMWVTITQNGSETSWEIVKATQWSTDSLDVVVRGQQNTVAADWLAGSKVQNRATAADYGLPALTTADIPDSTDKRYVTDAYLTLLGNTSGVNTGDQDLSPYLTSAAAASTYQPLATPLTEISALTPSNDDILQRKAGVWTNRTLAQIKADINLSGTNTGDQDLSPYLTSATAASTYVPLSQLGANNGVATLDNSGKLTSAQIPDVLLGGLNYKGGWNATTNTPAIPAASSSNKGWYYFVTTGGTTSIDGIADWAVGDWIVSNGTTWDKIDNTDSVISVNGQLGAIVLGYGDVGAQQANSKLSDIAGLSYTGNALKYLRVNAGETGWELATVASPTISDDNGTSATMYPMWTTAVGAMSTVYVSTTDLTWNPSTNALSIALAGAGSGFMFRTSSSSGALLGTNVNNQGGVTLGSVAQINWTNGNPVSGTPDVFLSRASAGVLSNTGAYQSLQAVAATSTDGLILATSATATSGNQKWSPALRLRGSVWSVTAAAAKTTDWKMEIEPIQGNTGISTLLVSHSMAGAAYSPMFAFRSDADWANAFVVIGTANGITYATTKGNADIHTFQRYDDYTGTGLSSGGTFRWAASSTSGASPDTFLSRGTAAANVQLGLAAANPPIAQTLSVQDASGTDIAGATFLVRGSRGTGAGAPGSIGLQVGVPGASGTTLQTAETQLTIAYHAATWVDALNFVFGSTTGTKIGTSTTQKIGFFNATPVVQPSAITAPAGGATVDSEARTAISSLISVLQTLGLTA